MGAERNLRPLNTRPEDQQQIISHTDNRASPVGHEGCKTGLLQRVACGSEHLA